MFKLSTVSISRFLWALVMVTLPVTSFRFMPFMGSGTYVRPLALYPLVLLLPVLLVRLKRGEITRPWPGTLTILLAFLLVALVATAIGATLAPIELRGVDFFDRSLRSVVTLVIGLSFFVASVWMNQTEADLKFSVKWLFVGLAAHLLWGAVQFIGLNNGYRQQLLQIQNLFSVRGLVKNKRISGFAYEPSWLAGQIAALYLPWLVAAVLTRYRALGNRQSAAGGTTDGTTTSRASRGGTTASRINNKRLRLQSLFEPILLLAALTGLLMTYSRSGLFIAFFAGTATFALTGKQAFCAFWGWLQAGFTHQRGITSHNSIPRVKNNESPFPVRRPMRWTNCLAAFQAMGSRILLAVLVLAVLTGVSFFLADKGYIAAFFKSEKTDLFSYAQDVYLGPRLAYANAALSAFDAHPLTGIGLGASGFGIYQNMPDWILSGEPEIAKQMSPASNLYPNPKNLYVRLLTETGLLGFMLFLAFYLTLLADALGLLRSSPTSSIPPIDHATDLLAQGTERETIAARWLATAGIFALTAVVLQGISQDSFAMPEMWINLGMLAGGTGAFKSLLVEQPLRARAENQSASLISSRGTYQTGTRTIETQKEGLP